MPREGSLKEEGGGSATRCFFFARLEGKGGVWSLPGGCWDYEAKRVPGRSRSTVRARLVTISSPKSAITSKGWVGSAAVDSVT